MTDTLDNAAVRRRVRPAVRLWYGIGEIAITVNAVLYGLFILFFYGSVMKLSPTLVGVGAATGLLWDALIDPYIGHRSDHCRGRLGRRHGFMTVGAVAMGPCFYLLMSPPRTLGTTATLAWLLLTSIGFRFAHALFRIPYLSLGAELSDDYHERTVIVGVRSFFGLCGTLAAASLSFPLFFPNAMDGTDPKLSYEGYPRMGATFGCVMTAAALVAVIGTPRSFGRSAAAPAVRGNFAAFWREFAGALGNRSFRALWLSFTLFFLAVVLNAAVAIHYFTWYVRITDSAALSRIQASFFLGALASLFVWVSVSRRMEKRRLCMIATAATAGLLTMATVLMGTDSVLGTGNDLALMVGHLLGGAFASALWVLPASMVADVADEEELRTGGRREGMLFGLLNVGEKIAAGIALLLGGVLLDALVGMVAGEPTGPEAVSRIGILYGVVPASLMAVSCLLLTGYRLDRGAVGTVQIQLRNRRHDASS